MGVVKSTALLSFFLLFFRGPNKQLKIILTFEESSEHVRQYFTVSFDTTELTEYCRSLPMYIFSREVGILAHEQQQLHTCTTTTTTTNRHDGQQMKVMAEVAGCGCVPCIVSMHSDERGDEQDGSCHLTLGRVYLTYVRTYTRVIGRSTKPRPRNDTRTQNELKREA